MSDSQFDPPKTLSEADDNIRQIREMQASLRRRGQHDKAREWDQDIAEQRAARKKIHQALIATHKQTFRR